MDGKPLRCKSQSELPPFLPPKRNDKSFDPKFETVFEKLKFRNGKNNKRTKNKTTHDENDISASGWALVTGASRGIGRSIAVELARYKIPLILVARDKSKLLELANQLEECYGITTKIIVSDFSDQNAAECLLKQIDAIKVKDKSVEIDCLIHNAGIGDTRELVDMDTKKIQDIITINLITGSKLCQMIGKAMKNRRRGRIVLISSITGIAPGVPTAAVYAATKAFLKSVAVSVGIELEPFGVGVTSIMPGAVHDTEFAVESDMKDATIWRLPFGKLTSQVVARSTVYAMIRGSPEIVVGWFNTLSCRFFFLLLPDRLISIICQLCFSPPPFFK